jgi:hypothetical protein
MQPRARGKVEAFEIARFLRMASSFPGTKMLLGITFAIPRNGAMLLEAGTPRELQDRKLTGLLAEVLEFHSREK